jgi:hypothetical protein
MKKIKTALEILKQDIRGNSKLNQKVTFCYIIRTTLISLYITYIYINKNAGVKSKSSRIYPS